MSYRAQGGFTYDTGFGLRLSAKGQYERQHTDTRREYDPTSVPRPRPLQHLLHAQRRHGAVCLILPPGGGILTQGSSLYEAYDLRTQADYSGTWGRFFSVYGNAAYTYDDRYSLTVSFRTDASNFQSKK